MPVVISNYQNNRDSTELRLAQLHADKVFFACENLMCILCMMEASHGCAKTALSIYNAVSGGDVRAVLADCA